MAKTTDTTDDDVKVPKGETAEDLRDLAGKLKGDLVKFAPKAGKVITHFETLLAKLGSPVKSIHADLGKLKEHLSGGEPDGKAIAKLLKSLSSKTGKVAEEQSGVVGTALKSLASALETGADSLTGN